MGGKVKVFYLKLRTGNFYKFFVLRILFFLPHNHTLYSKHMIEDKGTDVIWASVRSIRCFLKCRYLGPMANLPFRHESRDEVEVR